MGKLINLIIVLAAGVLLGGCDYYIVEPEITLFATEQEVIDVHGEFFEIGGSCNIKECIVEYDDSKLDLDTVGEYSIYYTALVDGEVKDKLVQIIEVVDNEAPICQNCSTEPVVIQLGEEFTDLGVLFIDNCDEPKIVYSETEIDYSVPGKYNLEYSITDSNGNSTTIVRPLEIIGEPDEQVNETLCDCSGVVEIVEVIKEVEVIIEVPQPEVEIPDTVNMTNVDILLERDNIQLVDLRDWEDKMAQGYIAGFEMIPYFDYLEREGYLIRTDGNWEFSPEDIGDRVILEHFFDSEADAIFLMCASGARAGYVKDALEYLGYTNVYNIGGIKDYAGMFLVQGDAKYEYHID